MRSILLITIACMIGVITVYGQQNKKNKVKNNKAEVYFLIINLKCESCKQKIEKELAFHKGVKDLSLDVSTKKLKVMYNPAKTNPEELIKALSRIGYTAQQIDSNECKKNQENRSCCRSR